MDFTKKAVHNDSSTLVYVHLQCIALIITQQMSFVLHKEERTTLNKSN